MPLVEELENHGKFLFRWRSYLPIVFLGPVLLAISQYEYFGGSETLDDVWQVFCLSVSFFGLAIRVITVGYTPRATSGRNTRRQKASVLNTTGIYSTVRHPLYLGNFFMYLGVVLLAHLWWLVLLYVLAFWIYYERIMITEEVFLRRQFGDTYLNWANNTPALLPHLGNYRKPNSRFSVKKVLRKEHSGFTAIIMIMTVLVTSIETVLSKKPGLELHWAILLSFGLTVWSTLTILKHKTTLLRDRA